MYDFWQRYGEEKETSIKPSLSRFNILLSLNWKPFKYWREAGACQLQWVHHCKALVPLKDEGLSWQTFVTLPTDFFFFWVQSKFQGTNGIVLAVDGLSEFLRQGRVDTGGWLQQPPESQVERWRTFVPEIISSLYINFFICVSPTAFYCFPLLLF